MKKSLALVFAFLLAFSLTSALNLDFPKSSFYPGETLQLQIPDIFTTSLQSSNLGIYRTGEVHKTPAESSMMKYQGNYYLSFVLPETLGNYTFKIENIEYQENTLSKEPITKEFTIASTNKSYLSVNPGQILTSSDFSITVKAYNAISKVNVNFKEAKFNQSFNLGYGSTKTVSFSIAPISTSLFSTIKINDYSIPIVIISINPNASNFTEISIDSPIDELIEILPSEINATILPNLDYFFEIKLKNKIFQTIRDLNISSPSNKLNITPSFFDFDSEEREINLTINTNKNLNTVLNVTYKNSSISIPIGIKVTKEESNISSNIPIQNLGKSCRELGGSVCNSDANEVCSGSEADSTDGACCLAECAVKKASNAWIWGLVLLAFLGVGGWFLYKKSKEAPSDERANQILKARAESYEKRVLPEPVEVKKSLERK